MDVMAVLYLSSCNLHSIKWDITAIKYSGVFFACVHILNKTVLCSTGTDYMAVGS